MAYFLSEECRWRGGVSGAAEPGYRVQVAAKWALKLMLGGGKLIFFIQHSL